MSTIFWFISQEFICILSSWWILALVLFMKFEKNASWFASSWFLLDKYTKGNTNQIMENVHRLCCQT